MTLQAYTLLGIDYGLARTGIAIGNSISRSATALTTLHTREHKERFIALEKIIKEWEVTHCVIGVPFHPDGNRNPMTQNCEKFVKRFKARFPDITVIMEDERYTSVLSKGDDADAAAMILQSYLHTL